MKVPIMRSLTGEEERLREVSKDFPGEIKSKLTAANMDGTTTDSHTK